MQHILIVEDERSIAEAVRTFLNHAGFHCTLLGTAVDVVPTVERYRPDLIVLDVMLPGGDGIELCRQIREISEVPIIMLTAKTEEAERLQGLEAGADDYVCKPFSAPELVLRVKAILRRRGAVSRKNPKHLQLDANTQEAKLGEVVINLTTLEFALLSTLSANPNRIYSRDAIMNLIYPDHRIVSDRTVDSHVSNLRKKLKLLSPHHELISGVYGSGYKFSPIK